MSVHYAYVMAMTSMAAPALATLVIILSASAALAGDTGKQVQKPLPGVNGGYSIVKPAAPQPEPDDYDPATGRQFKVGNMDVRISGSVTVDIGAGDISTPRR